MEQPIPQRQLDEIVYKLRIALRKDIKDMLADTQPPDLVTTKEAASIIGITPGRLRQIVCEDPQRYPHIKKGENKQAKLLFDRKALLQ